MKNVTKGKAEISKYSETAIVCISERERLVATTGGYSDNSNPEQVYLENISNAQLIAEAFNVHNDTGLSPMELKEQRDELLEGVKLLLSLSVSASVNTICLSLINTIENNG